MWRYRPTYGFNKRWVYCTHDDWLAALMTGLFQAKAPKSWVEQQADIGRPPVAAYSIWAKYPVDRKWGIWALAEESDAKAAGYMLL